MFYKKTKAKEIVHDLTVINSIVNRAVNEMATIVGRTLGPGGNPVLIEREDLSPLITKDGVTVAKAIGVSDAKANVIMETAKEICLNTGKDAGDGTTTAIVFANALIQNGQDFLTTNTKYNPHRLVSELKDAYNNVVVPFLKDKAIQINGDDDLLNVATISANGDKEVAKVVVTAINLAGEDGTVLIEEDQGNVLRVESVEGYVVVSGLKEFGRLGPIFINDRAHQQAKMDHGIVFLYDGTVNDLEVPAIIQTAIENTELYGKPIIVMAHDFADNVLDKFAASVKAGYMIVPVKTPMSPLPNSRTMFLFDMAAYTGATVYDPGMKANITKDGFGNFLDAKINMYETVIQCESDFEDIEERVEELKAIHEAAASDFDKMFVKASIGKLNGGLATIYVGGATEIEIRERKARVEDAVESVKSAISEGIIPGGCIIHLMLSSILKNHPDKKPSWDILVKSLERPFHLLISNCGEEPQFVYDSLKTSVDELKFDKVFNADSHNICDPIEAGIVEPVKVCRVALENALSVASLLMTLGGLVIVPRDSGLESQIEMQSNAFSEIMNTIK